MKNWRRKRLNNNPVPREFSSMYIEALYRPFFDDILLCEKRELVFVAVQILVSEIN